MRRPTQGGAERSLASTANRGALLKEPPPMLVVSIRESVYSVRIAQSHQSATAASAGVARSES